MSQKTQFKIEDIPADVRKAFIDAGWAALDAFLFNLERDIPECEFGGYKKELAPLLRGLLENFRQSINGQIIGHNHEQ